MSTVIETSNVAETSAHSKTYNVLRAASPIAIFYFCRDNKIRRAVESWIPEEFGFDLDECILMSEYGRVFYSTEPDRLPSAFTHFKDELIFSINEFPTVRYVVGINHDHCRRYDVAHALWGDEFLDRCASLKGRQHRDLSRFTQYVHRTTPRPVQVRSFHMDLADDQRTKTRFRHVG